MASNLIGVAFNLLAMASNLMLKEKDSVCLQAFFPLPDPGDKEEWMLHSNTTEMTMGDELLRQKLQVALSPLWTFFRIETFSIRNHMTEA